MYIPFHFYYNHRHVICLLNQCGQVYVDNDWVRYRSFQLFTQVGTYYVPAHTTQHIHNYTHLLHSRQVSFYPSIECEIVELKLSSWNYVHTQYTLTTYCILLACQKFSDFKFEVTSGTQERCRQAQASSPLFFMIVMT